MCHREVAEKQACVGVKRTPMFTSFTVEAEFALRAVGAGCSLARMVQRELAVQAISKEDRSPVTVADFAVQAVVAHMLKRAFPADPLVGEEAGDALRRDPATGELVARYAARLVPEATPAAVADWIDAGREQPGSRFWALDPVDGTKGFLRGDQYAVALALLRDGQVMVGALGCPNLNRNLDPEPGGEGALLIAVRGEGAHLGSLSGEHSRRLRVSDCADPTRARLLRSFESAHTSDAGTEAFVAALGMAGQPVKMDSQAKYALLAAGKAEALLRLLSPSQPDYREKIWDQAAGSIILEEAGGRITDLAGRPLDFSAGRTLARNRGVLATNGRLHEAALAALRQGQSE